MLGVFLGSQPQRFSGGCPGTVASDWPVDTLTVDMVTPNDASAAPGEAKVRTGIRYM